MARHSNRKPKIPTKRWVGVDHSALAQAAGTVGIEMRAADVFPDTVLRTRGEFYANLDGVGQTPGVFVRYGFGMICVPEGTGSTVVWSPLSDPNASWFVYQSGHLAYEEYVTDVTHAIPGPSIRAVIDSKAMRKVHPDMELQAVYEQSTIGGASSINFAFAGRILLGR